MQMYNVKCNLNERYEGIFVTIKKVYLLYNIE